MVQSTTPETKLRKLNPQKLFLPKEVIIKRQQRQEEIRMKNPVYRFLKTFFGEGF